MIRLLIAEDSPTAREMFSYLFDNEPDIEIVAMAKDGEEAIKLVDYYKPDLLLMDVNMPNINGYESSKIIMNTNPLPIILMSATFDVKEVKNVVDIMKIGVLGVYEKPYGFGHPRCEELYNEISSAIRLMSEVKVIRQINFDKKVDKVSKNKFKPIQNKTFKYILIGSSTGGPPVLQNILRSLPKDYPFPILIAQHMSSDFISSFVEWLNFECDINVKLAVKGESLKTGTVYIAPSGYHLCLWHDKIDLRKATCEEHNIPSISKLFGSVDNESASNTVAIILTGMGRDGADEIKMLRDKQALTIGQNKESCAVYSMVYEAQKIDALDYILPPEKIAELLIQLANIRG